MKNILKSISNFSFYQVFLLLGGASDYSLYSKLSKSMKALYNFYSVWIIFISIVSFKSGYTIGYTMECSWVTSTSLGLVVAFLMVLFDSHLSNDRSNSKYKYIFRFIFSLVFTSLSACLVAISFFSDSIENEIKLDRGSSISIVDNTYEAEKKARFKKLTDLENNWDKSHQKCIDEQNRKDRPGRGGQWEFVHSGCVADSIIIEKVKADLNTKEVKYYNEYQEKRSISSSLSMHGVIVYLKYLFVACSKDGVISVFVFCFFIILFCIDLMILFIKMTKKYDAYDKLVDQLEEILDRENEESLYHDSMLRQLNSRNNRMDIYMQRQDDFLLKFEKMKINEKILHDIGIETFYDFNTLLYYHENNMIELSSSMQIKTLQMEAKHLSMYMMTEPMKGVVNKLRSKYTGEELIEQIFNWIRDNIEYHKDHNLDF